MQVGVFSLVRTLISMEFKKIPVFIVKDGGKVAAKQIMSHLAYEYSSHSTETGTSSPFLRFDVRAFVKKDYLSMSVLQS